MERTKKKVDLFSSSNVGTISLLTESSLIAGEINAGKLEKSTSEVV